MATHWVDITSGSDSNGGTSYADAVKTLPKAHDLLEADADTAVNLNIVNSGTYNLTADLNETYVSAGTTSQTFTIRGVDSAGNPAQVTVESLGAGTAQRFFQFWRGNVIYENFLVDWTPSSGLTGTQYFHKDAGNGDIGDLTFNYCHFRAYAYGSVGTKQPSNQVWDAASAGSREGVRSINYCLFENMRQGINSPVQWTQLNTDLTVDHCTVLDKYVTHDQLASFIRYGVAAPTDQTFVFTNNTLSGQMDAKTNIPPYVLLGYTSAGVIDECTIHDNVLFLDNIGGSLNSSVTVGLMQFAGIASPGTITATIENIGYNVFYAGADYPWADFTLGLYAYGLSDAFVSDPLPTDATSFGSATEGTLFNDPSSTYEWSVGSISITVPADVRLIAEQTSGTGGAVPGALPASTTDYTVAVSSSRTAPKVGESLVLTVAVSNSGSSATGVKVNAAIPTGLTLVSSSASAGSYAAGVWTVGTLADSGAELLQITCTVDAGTEGNSITFTGTWAEGSPGTGGSTSDDTDSVLIRVLDTADPQDPDGSGAVPYIDTYPIYATDLKLSLNSGIKLRKNREVYGALRGDIEDVRWREGSFRCINLAGSTTTKLVLGGIERGEYLIMDSTTQIQISVGNGTNLYFPAKFVVLGSGDFEQVYLKNIGTTAATVHIGVTD
jgi:uncharacterized repeat protein (TIGR01451 family)